MILFSFKSIDDPTFGLLYLGYYDADMKFRIQFFGQYYWDWLWAGVDGRIASKEELLRILADQFPTHEIFHDDDEI